MRGIALALCAVLMLTGCSALLEREYSVSEPHSSKFWESEESGTLRAENYQDIVNDLLILVEQHTETATLRLYQYEGEEPLSELLERAAMEVQQETPMGAYAVEYITSSAQTQPGYHEIAVRIGYRRTAEQLSAVVNATSTDALTTLLDTALTEGRQELAVRIGHWGADGDQQIQNAAAVVRQRHGLEQTPPWTVTCYPAEGPVGLVEFQMGSPG